MPAKLFLTFAKIGFLGFGGGYMMIPLFFLELTQRHHWLTHDQVFNILAISQTIPGTFAANTAALVGLTLGGPVYGLIAAFAIISPSLPAAYLADRYVRPRLKQPETQSILKGLAAVVIGIILGAGMNMAHGAIYDWKTIIAALAAFGLFFFRDWNPMASMLTAAGAVTIAAIFCR
ncbi:MAG: chromate transporter [Solirubrobacterales bacterium]